ncbi:hypothetical protein V2J09_016775 [Rumex salicifolius]
MCYSDPLSGISKAVVTQKNNFAMDVDRGSPIKCGMEQKLHDDLEERMDIDKASAVFHNSPVIMNTIECELSCDNKDKESLLLESKWTATDESMALWVKWRGKWQSGIKCARADWPLDTVRARPSHDRKNYIVVYFPHNRNYSWVDTYLVRPIDNLPEPIVHESYEAGIQLVKDLSIAQKIQLQNLAFGVLNIFDNLHFQVLVETARNIEVLKEFATEATECTGYTDLGRTLVNLQKMVLDQYIDSKWLRDSFNSWAKRCQNAQNAESVELLREELVNSILWKEISALQGFQVLSANGSEWKMWKHEFIKLISSSHDMQHEGEPEKPNKSIIEHTLSLSPQVSRKRPKLEVRRAEAHTFQAESKGQQEDTIAEIDSEYFVRHNTEQKHESIADPSNVIVGAKSRKCKAFIEAKGRQCVRWANEGDEYCCVHLAARFTGNAIKSVAQPVIDAPLCGGTTTQGNQCKHRALPGSLYCKKHRPRDGSVMEDESEQPLQVEPLSMRVIHNGRSSVVKMPEHFNTEMPCCIGLGIHDGIQPCLESPTRHGLYCDKHIPSWLKRARNGKTRIISKEVFMEILRGCSTKDQKVHLHQACELFYKLFKSIQSTRNQVPREIQFQWAISEVSKDSQAAEFLMRLVCSEKARITRIWGFGSDKNQPTPVTQETSHEGSFKCMFCSEDFADDQALGNHWIKIHNKEAQWYFRGYACSICFDPFTNRKVLETHVQERHHAQFSDHCMLYRCIPCGGHFGTSEELWSHVLSSHTNDFRQCIKSVERQPDGADLSIQPDLPLSLATENNSDKKYICKFCGLKFDLLPDLGRHHQAAHSNPGLSISRHLNKGVRFYAYRLKSGRLTRPKFKRSLGGGVPYVLKKKVAANLKKRLQASNSVNPPHHPKGLGILTESECLSIAETLFCEAQNTRARPNNMEILNIARSSCCKVSLQASLEKYGVLPKCLYLKAAKLCVEHNTRVNWHQEGFSCPKGCEPPKDENVLTLLSSDHIASVFVPPLEEDRMEEWEKDECHYIISSNDLRHNYYQTTIILCDDISFGKEATPITCVIDKNMIDLLHVPSYGLDGQVSYLPWEDFNYVIKPKINLSLIDTQSLLLKHGCSQSECSPETCDQVYLFNTDNEDAKDIYGMPMTGRFPYDEIGKIMLEQGYPVYECNHLCSCSKSCPNRILQNGIQVKLEVFKTLKKGWAVKAGELISRGAFVCELIGEVIDEEEAIRRHKRYGNKLGNYIYNAGGYVNKMTQLMEETVSFVIDASKYGSVSRFINHGCSPNLVTRPVVVESMEYALARIGLYAARDIAVGEELTFDYGDELLPGGERSHCLCRSSNCRARLF